LPIDRSLNQKSRNLRLRLFYLGEDQKIAAFGSSYIDRIHPQLIGVGNPTQELPKAAIF